MLKLSNLYGFNAASGLPAGVVLDLDASKGITKDGSNKVSAWADSSSQGNNASQATGTLQPTWVDTYFNGRPAITFDGSDDYLAISNTIFSRNYTVATTVIAVWKKESDQSGIRRFFDATATSNQFQMGLGCGYDFNDNKPTAFIGKSTVVAQNASDASTISAGTKLITAGAWGSNAVHLWKNGTDVANLTANATIQSASTNSNGWSLGAGRENGSTVFPANVSIARVIMWNRTLASTELAKVMNQFGKIYL